MAQIRQAVTEYAVLPLGSQRVHEKLEPHIKALLLYGHHNTGKKLLAHAIANSTGAIFPSTAMYALLRPGADKARQWNSLSSQCGVQVPTSSI